MASLDVIIKQIVLSAFRSANMESASPGKINRFIGMEGGEMDIIGSNEEINAAIREAVQGFTEDPDSADNLAQNLLDSEEKTGKKKGTKEAQASSLVSKGTGAIQNPASIVAAGLQYLPHAALVLLAVKLGDLIFDELTRPGGVLDLRFKRILEVEFNAFLSRQTQKDTEMGVRQVIIQGKKGFTASNGLTSFNSVRGIREGGLDKDRLSRLGLSDQVKGLL